MPYSEIDLTTAVVYDDATIVGDTIVCGTGSGGGGWVIPGLTREAAKRYRFRFELTTTTGDPSGIAVYSLDAAESYDDSNWFSLGGYYGDIREVAAGDTEFVFEIDPSDPEFSADIADADTAGEFHMIFFAAGVTVTRMLAAERTGTTEVAGPWLQEPDYIVDQPATTGDEALTDGSTAFDWTYSEDIEEPDVGPLPPLPDLGAAMTDVATSTSGTWGAATSHDPIGFSETDDGGLVRGSTGWNTGLLNNARTFAAALYFPYVWQPAGAITPLDPTEPVDDDLDLEYVDTEWDPEGTTIIGAELNYPYKQVNYDTTQDPSGVAVEVAADWVTRLRVLTIPLAPAGSTNPIDSYDAETDRGGPFVGAPFPVGITSGSHGTTGLVTVDVMPYLYDSAGLVAGDKAGHFGFTPEVVLEGSFPTAGGNDGRMGIGAGRDPSADFYVTYTVEQPQYRYLYSTPVLVPMLPGLAKPVLRVYPRGDGLGASTVRRHYPPPISQQRSNRRGGGTYL